VRHTKFDLIVDETMLQDLPPVTRDYLGMIMYKRQDGSKTFVICTDHARHFNHSDSPSCGNQAIATLTPEQRAQLTPAQWAAVDSNEGATVAIRDIAAGEELTCNYLTDFPDPSDPHMTFLYEKKH